MAESAAVGDGQGEQEHIGQLFRAVNARVIDLRWIENTDGARPELVHGLGCCRLQAAGDRFAAGFIGGPDAGAETEVGVVGDAHGIVVVAGAEDTRGRAEQFFDIGRHAGFDMIEDGRGVMRGALPRRAAEQQLRTGSDAALHLIVDFIAQIGACHRCQRGRRVGRITNHKLACGFDKARDESISDSRGDDEALGGNAGLPGIAETRCDCGGDR